MWVLGIELLSGRAVHALNFRTIFAVLSYARYAFISFGNCDRQNFPLKTFVAGISPVNMWYCVLKRTLQMQFRYRCNFAEGTNRLTLRLEDYPGLTKGRQCDYRSR